MGRSVSYPSEAEVVCYSHFTGEGEECGSELEFDLLIEDFRESVTAEMPGQWWEADSWIGRENHVLMASNLFMAGMSEYCGLVAYWLVPVDTEDEGLEVEVERHAGIARFRELFDNLRPIGTASNGEQFFERI
jgi:hypothetical protein